MECQGWRGLNEENAVAPWVPCTKVPCLERQKRPMGIYDIMYMFGTLGSSMLVSSAGYYFYHQICEDEKKRNLPDKEKRYLCKNMMSDKTYAYITMFGGISVMIVLFVTRIALPRFRFRHKKYGSVFGFVGDLFEIGFVAILGSFLHVHLSWFCWLFLALTLFDICVFKLLSPSYDFKGPAILGQIAICASLFPNLRSWSFTPAIFFCCFAIFVLKALLDVNWRKKVPVHWTAFLVHHGLMNPLPPPPQPQPPQPQPQPAAPPPPQPQPQRQAPVEVQMVQRGM